MVLSAASTSPILSNFSIEIMTPSNGTLPPVVPVPPADNVTGMFFSENSLNKSIRPYINSVRVLLSDGFVLDIKRGQFKSKKRKFDFKYEERKFSFDLPKYVMPSVKHSAGYFVEDNMDIVDLFIGQEGTLGCILEVELQAQTMALDFFDVIVFFENEKNALKLVNALKDLKKNHSFYPCSLEFFDYNSLDFLRCDYNTIPEDSCAVYFEQSIEFAEQSDEILEYYSELIEKCGASLDDCWFAEDAKNRQRLRDFRHKLPQRINEFLRIHKTQKMATDIAVPDDKFQEMYDFYKKSAEKSGLYFVNFGHIGQNHLHFNFLPKDKEESFKMKGYILEIVEKAISLGGTISAEHGIGKIKKPYLEMLYGKKHLKQMANLKKVLDPACILNLDNVFNKDYLKG